MKFPISGYVVMMDHPDYGTFAPSFRNMDQAEEFSNAMRLATNFAVAEPVPMVSAALIAPRQTEYVEH